MLQTPLVIYSDFICPFCYIGKINAERMQQQLPDLQIVWREFELHPEGQPDPASPYMQQARQAVEQLADRYAIDMRADVLTTVTSDSHRALLGLAYAREQGREDSFREAVFKAYWCQGRDIGDIDELGRVAAEAGLDQEAFRQAITAEAYEPILAASLQQARRAGIEGVPTFIMGDRQLVGAQPADTLLQFVNAAAGHDADGVCRQ